MRAKFLSPMRLNDTMHWLFIERLCNLTLSNYQYLTDEIREKLPPLYANEKLELDALAQVKYFDPSSNLTWYASEFDGDDTFFGLASDLFGMQLEYFYLSQLKKIRGNLGLPIERDLHFEPTTLRELKKLHKKGFDG